MSEWKSTACILCECNCGIEVELGGPDGRRLVRFRGDDAHPASRGYACEKPGRLDYYQNGPHRLTKPLRRRADGTLRGDRLGHRDPRGRGALRSGARHATAARRSSITAAAGRATTFPARTRRDAPGARLGASVERARAGEDRRVLGRRARCSAATLAPTSSTARSLVSRQEPLAFAQHPARARHAERDREGPRALSHRGRSAPHRDGRDRGHPPAGEARHRRVAARRDDRRAGAGGPHRPRLPRRARGRPRARCCRTSLRSPIAAACARAAASTRRS